MSRRVECLALGLVLAAGIGCGEEPGPLGPSPIDGTPVGGCSDLARLLNRYEGREFEVCGPPGGEFRELVSVGRGYFLVRNYFAQVLELWNVNGEGRLGGGPVASYPWAPVAKNTFLINLGQDRVLTYDQQLGRRIIYEVNVSARFVENPIGAPVGNPGSWQRAVTGRDLLALDDDHVLDWEPGTGAFAVWTFDRDNERDNPFRPMTDFVGKRDAFVRGHRLVALGRGRLLEWVPATGAFRVWSFSWDAGAGDPFTLVTEGRWTDLTADHEIVVVDDGRLLIWSRGTGDVEVRAFDPRGLDPLAPLPGAAGQHESYERLRSLPRDWAPPTEAAIRRVVIILQRGRSFDHHFGQYCTAAPKSKPTCTVGPGCCEGMPPDTPGAVAGCHVVDPAANDYAPNDSSDCLVAKMNGGLMDSFVISSLDGCGDARDFACLQPDSAGVMGAYHSLAAEGALADQCFQSVVGTPYSNFVYFGTTGFGDDPAHPPAYETIGSLLARRQVPWTIYLGDPVADSKTYMLSMPPYYDGRWSHFRYLSELARDVELKQLGSVSVIIPPEPLSELPGKGAPQEGAALVASIVESILSSSQYQVDTLVLVNHITAGGFYDHVKPPDPLVSRYDGSGLPYGPRVPLLALGRFARPNHVSHVRVEVSSITKFLEWNWLGGETGQLGGRDRAVNNIGDLLVTAAGKPVPIDSSPP